jgi:hypothetical protein
MTPYIARPIKHRGEITMANYKTGAERYNDRMSKIWETARKIERERLARGEAPNPSLTNTMDWFVAEWERTQGYKPAAFQKAIALQRIQRGQSIREIIESLVSQRI